MGGVDVSVHPQGRKWKVADGEHPCPREFAHSVMFNCAKSGVEITGAKRVNEHATMLLVSMSSPYDHLMPRVRLLMISFTPPGRKVMLSTQRARFRSTWRPRKTFRTKLHFGCVQSVKSCTTRRSCRWRSLQIAV